MPLVPLMPTLYDLAIIGGGPVGLAAAMYAGRMNLKTVIFSNTWGGDVITTTDVVENYPGFIRLTGRELTQKLEEHARQYDVDFVDEEVKGISKVKTCFSLQAESKKIMAKSLLLVTGAKHRELKVPGHDKYFNRGVHYCALCDAAIYGGKVMAVVGGSDSAAKEALVMAQHASKVYMIYRGDKIRPEPINGKRIEQNKKIQVITNTNVVEILGDKVVSKIRLDRPFQGMDTIDVSALFVAIGFIPRSELAASVGVKLNEKKEVIIDRRAQTNVPGFFAAGDVADSEFKQAITGVGEGTTAVYMAYKYVNENEFVCTFDDAEYHKPISKNHSNLA